MWLINTTSIRLERFQDNTEPYAILSHTWGADAEEVHFGEFQIGQGKQKKGYRKIELCCEEARRNGIPYAWVDTCCIDKNSSAELSEAINSMFRWYQDAKVCYVYMADVELEEIDNLARPKSGFKAFKDSKWFTRGWTLQELLASQLIQFYSHDWINLGNGMSLCTVLEETTGIDRLVLLRIRRVLDCSIAERMSWASLRHTTRPEDQAYCLLGIFNVNMPLLYGEGTKAFLRLQRKIIKTSDDETIFAWWNVPAEGSGLLAPSAKHFAGTTVFRPATFLGERAQYYETHKGLSFQCKMLPCEMNTYAVQLNCRVSQRSLLPLSGASTRVVIFLCRTTQDDKYRRIPCRGRSIFFPQAGDWKWSQVSLRTIYIPSDTRKLQLCPHGKLPTVHIKSPFETWHFERIVQTTPPIHDPSTESASLSNDSIHSPISDSHIVPCLPEATDRVQFSAHDLERGILLAFKNSSKLFAPFDMYVQFGFDLDFNVICIQHDCSFLFLAHALQYSDSLSLKDFLSWTASYLYHHTFSRRWLYLYKSMWNELTTRNMWCLDLGTLDFVGRDYIPQTIKSRVSALRKPWSSAICIPRLADSSTAFHIRPWFCSYREVTIRPRGDTEYELEISNKRWHKSTFTGAICMECAVMWSMSVFYLLIFIGIVYLSGGYFDHPLVNRWLQRTHELANTFTSQRYLYLGKNLGTFYVTETFIRGFQQFIIWKLHLPGILHLLGSAMLFPAFFTYFVIAYLSVYSWATLSYGLVLGLLWSIAWDALSFFSFFVREKDQPTAVSRIFVEKTMNASPAGDADVR